MLIYQPIIYFAMTLLGAQVPYVYFDYVIVAGGGVSDELLLFISTKVVLISLGWRSFYEPRVLLESGLYLCQYAVVLLQSPSYWNR